MKKNNTRPVLPDSPSMSIQTVDNPAINRLLNWFRPFPLKSFQSALQKREGQISICSPTNLRTRSGASWSPMSPPSQSEDDHPQMPEGHWKPLSTYSAPAAAGTNCHQKWEATSQHGDAGANGRKTALWTSFSPSFPSC